MKKLTKLHWLLIAVIVAVIFALIALYVYKTDAQQIRKEKFAYLDAIANLKADQISKWRTERISEALSFPSYEKVIYSTRILSKNKNDEESNNYLNRTLRPIQQRHNYKDIFITDLNHNVIFSLNNEFGIVDTLTVNAIHESISGDSLLFTDFYYCKTHSEIHLDIVSPIKNNNKLIGVMVFRFDPRSYLYPLIQQWPTPSQSAECAIVTDEDTQIRILSDVRFRENSALNITITKNDTHYVSVKALSSNRTILDGLDYRRVNVLASVKKIAGTKWMLVSKIDQDEIFEDIQYKSVTITLITIFAFLLFGVLIMFLYKNRQSQVYKDLFFKEKQLNEFQAQTKAITEAAQDAIIMMDEKGNISFWNPAAEKIFGYKADEILGHNLHKILAPESFHHLHFTSFEKFKESGDGNAVGSINEFSAVRKDGKKIPIELSLSALRSDEDWHAVGIIRDISERKSAESKLAESEEKFRKAFITSPDSVNINRMKDGMYVSVNEGYRQLTGYKEEEVIGKTSFEINIWNNLDDRKKLVKGLTENGYVQNLEAEFRVKDGTLKYCLMSASVIQLKDEPHILSITRDITERKKIERALKISEQGYHQIINGMKDTVYVITLIGQFIDVNQAACDMLEYTREELVKLSPFDIDDTLSAKQIKELITRIPIVKQLTFQTTHISKSKKRIPVEITSTVINYKGEECILSIARDITPWLKAQENIFKSQSLLNETQRLAKVGGWEWDIEQNKMYWTDECFRIHGVNPLEIKSDPEEFISKSIECYNDADKPIVMSSFNRCVKEGIAYDLEFEFTNFKGEKLWIRTLAEPVFFENKIVKVIGNIIDITERVYVMDELRKSENRFRELFESMEEGFYLTELVYDENGKPVDCKFIDVNPAHSKITGLQRNEVIGNTLGELFPGLEQQWFDAHIDVAVTGKPKTIEGFVSSLTRYFILHIYSPRKGQCAVLFLDITDKKLVEKKLKETEERWQFAIEGSDDGVWDWNIKTGEVYFSSRWKTMLGYKVDEIKNEITEWESRVHPQDLEFVLAEIDKHLKGETEFYGTEHRMLCRDGSYKWILDRGKILVRDAEGNPLRMVGTHKDITERRIAEQTILESEEKYRNLIDIFQDSVFVNKEGIIVFANPACINLFAAESINEIVGKPPFDFFHPDYHKIVESRIGEMLKTGRSVNTIEEKIITLKGDIIDVEVSATPFQLDGVTAIQVVLKDITARKLTEKELEEYRNSLELKVAQRTEEIQRINKELVSEIEKKEQTEILLHQSLEKEKELNQLKSRFISTASHEFRTPLTTILSSAELIQRYGKKWEEEKYKDHLVRITNSVEYLTNLMDDVLTISRIESGRTAFTPSNINLKELCEKVISDIQLSIAEKHKLNFNFLPKENHFFVDPKQMQIIIQNLLSNAFKYSVDGDKIDFTIETDENLLHIKVSDDGYGISDEDLTHLFEPFYRSLNTESIQGTGLGLTIVKNAVEMHGGTISVYSKLGEGTTFLINIPLGRK